MLPSCELPPVPVLDLVGIFVVAARLGLLGDERVPEDHRHAARTRDQGKKLTWRDGVKALFVLLRIRLTPAEELFGKRDPYHEKRLTELSLPGLRFGGPDETAESRGTLPG